MDDDEIISIPEIQKATGNKSRSYVYASVLPHLDVRKVGATTGATRKSFREYLKDLPRVTFPLRAGKVA